MASRVWKDGTRRGIAYVEGRETADRVLAAAGRSVGESDMRRRRGGSSDGENDLTGAMAVYLDKKGRPFAWQIPFDMKRWEQVAALIDTDESG